MHKLGDDKLVQAVDQQVNHVEEFKMLIRKQQQTQQQQGNPWVQMTDQNR